jgi:hypothetical protein
MIHKNNLLPHTPGKNKIKIYEGESGREMESERGEREREREHIHEGISLHMTRAQSHGAQK